ncbi:MAG: hypothetical protein AAF492_30430, partial [Verrucomicrobiota bacterium]
PNLYDLLLNGQENLGVESHVNGVMSLSNITYTETVTARIGYDGDGTHSAKFNQSAVDDDPGMGVNLYTINMRNQAQVHQTELFGTNNFTFSLGFQAVLSDLDGDGIPNVVEDQYAFLDATNGTDGAMDQDGDGVSNAGEYIANTQLDNPSDVPHIVAIENRSTGYLIRVDTKLDRHYYIQYANTNLLHPNWLPVNTNPIIGTGAIEDWLDNGGLTLPPLADPALQRRYYRTRITLPP